MQDPLNHIHKQQQQSSSMIHHIPEMSLFTADSMFTVICDSKGELQIHSNEALFSEIYPNVFKKSPGGRNNICDDNDDDDDSVSGATKFTESSYKLSLVSTHSLPSGELPQKILIEGGPLFIQTQSGSMFLITRPSVLFEKIEPKMMQFDLPFQVKNFSCNDQTLVLLSEDEKQWESQVVWQIDDVNSIINQHDRNGGTSFFRKKDRYHHHHMRHKRQQQQHQQHQKQLEMSILNKVPGAPIGITSICVGSKHVAALDENGCAFLWSCKISHSNRSSSPSLSPSLSSSSPLVVKVLKPRKASERNVQITPHKGGFLVRNQSGKLSIISMNDFTWNTLLSSRSSLIPKPPQSMFVKKVDQKIAPNIGFVKSCGSFVLAWNCCSSSSSLATRVADQEENTDGWYISGKFGDFNSRSAHRHQGNSKKKRIQFVHLPEFPYPNFLNGCSSGSMAKYCVFSNDANQLFSIGDYKPFMISEMAPEFRMSKSCTFGKESYPIMLFPEFNKQQQQQQQQKLCTDVDEGEEEHLCTDDEESHIDEERRTRKLQRMQRKIASIKNLVNSSYF